MTASEKKDTAEWKYQYKEVSPEDGIKEKFEHGDPYPPKKINWLSYWGEYKAVFPASMAMICTGAVFGWMGPALPILMRPDSPIPVQSSQIPLIASLVQFGSLPGSIVTSIIADTYGRKKPILFLAVPYLASYIILAYATTIYELYLSRIMAGLALGSSFALIPMYISEVASPKIRGALGSATGIFLNLGVLFCYCVGPYFTISQTAMIFMVIPVVMFILSLGLPETPYYLSMKGDLEQVEKVLIQLRGRKDNREEIKMLTESARAEKADKKSMFHLFTNSLNRKILYISCGLLIVQQMSGVAPVLTYSQIIFETVESSISANTSGILLAIMNFFVTFIVTCTVDSCGRRPLLILSALSTFIPLATVSGYFYLKEINSPLAETLSLAPTIGIILFKFTYGIGLGSLPFLCMAELFPTNVKAQASCFNAIFMTAMSFIAILIYQMISDNFGVSVGFGTFAVLTFFSALFVYVFVPETRGRPFEDIQRELRGE